MQAKIATVTKQTVTVNNLGNVLTGVSPFTLKNQITEITSIEQIADVDEINVTTGATLIYNSSTDKYEIKPLQFTDISGTVDLDGGTF